MSNIMCPVCGSEDLTQENRNEKRQLTLGQPYEYSVVVYHCNNCGEYGDFSEENETVRLHYLELAEDKLAADLIEQIEERKISNASFERALEIPPRTLTKWKKGKVSATGLALLRLITAMPWLLLIAEAKYTPLAMAQVLSKALHELCVKHNIPISFEKDHADEPRVVVTFYTPQQQVPNNGFSTIQSGT
ncbi:hypothetical protein ACNH6C_06870 [Bdellovibrio bacteriovorus]|uniref:hypothetical protein n=1 Tax=Bdellovibrio bacteriovorus TaxID=959 RepID=UPI003A800720